MNNLPIKIELPEQFLNEEIRCGYTITTKMKKVWAVELDLLSEFNRVCKKYSLQWWADGGTMLGAVRHGGFIPWDDDIDVMMLRKDYERLCSVGTTEFKMPYLLQNNHTEVCFLRGPRALLRNTRTTGILDVDRPLKLPFNQGIFIDIFPVDIIPDNIQKQNRLISKLTTLETERWNFCGMIYSSVKLCKNPIRLSKRINAYLLARFLGRDRLIKKLNTKHERLLLKYQNCNTSVVAELTTFPIKRENRIWKSDWFVGKMLFSFEFVQIPVLRSYNDFLTCLYGDWHKMIKGTSYHQGIFFDPEKPYKEYIS